MGTRISVAPVVLALDPPLAARGPWLPEGVFPLIFPATQRGLSQAFAEAKKITKETGPRPVLLFLPSREPELVARAALERQTDRLAVIHQDARLSSAKEALLRAAFAVVDHTVVFDVAGERAAVRLGADAERISVIGGAEGPRQEMLHRVITEPRRRARRAGVMEACASLALDGLAAVGAVRAAEKLTRKRGANVVNYHRVLPMEEYRSYGRPQMATPASIFEAQIEELSDLTGFVRVEDVRSPAARGRTAITFDDGYEDNFRVAFPILQRFSTPACIFVVTGLIGASEALWWDRVGLSLFAYWRSGAKVGVPSDLPRRARALEAAQSYERARQIISEVLTELNDVDAEARDRAVAAAESLVPKLDLRRTMLTWAEVRQMQRLGITFGAHTRNHVNLEHVTPEVAREEILGAQVDLELELGTELADVRLVALPRGRLGPLEETELRRNGFSGVMTTAPGINPPSDPSLFVLRRDGNYLTLRGRHHPAKLRLELTGVFDRFRPSDW
ncbi:MAG: polysaccharide deacetylase family protein [Myxococcota bacterium]